MVFDALYKYPANLYLFVYLSNCFYCKKKKDNWVYILSK